MLERALEIEVVLVVLCLGCVAFGFDGLGRQQRGVTELPTNGITALLVFRDALCDDIACSLQRLLILGQRHRTLLEDLLGQGKQSFLDRYVGTRLTVRFVR